MAGNAIWTGARAWITDGLADRYRPAEARDLSLSRGQRNPVTRRHPGSKGVVFGLGTAETLTGGQRTPRPGRPSGSAEAFRGCRPQNRGLAVNEPAQAGPLPELGAIDGIPATEWLSRRQQAGSTSEE